MRFATGGAVLLFSVGAAPVAADYFSSRNRKQAFLCPRPNLGHRVPSKQYAARVRLQPQGCNPDPNGYANTPGKCTKGVYHGMAAKPAIAPRYPDRPFLRLVQQKGLEPHGKIPQGALGLAQT